MWRIARSAQRSYCLPGILAASRQQRPPFFGSALMPSLRMRSTAGPSGGSTDDLVMEMLKRIIADMNALKTSIGTDINALKADMDHLKTGLGAVAEVSVRNAPGGVAGFTHTQLLSESFDGVTSLARSMGLNEQPAADLCRLLLDNMVASVLAYNSVAARERCAAMLELAHNEVEKKRLAALSSVYDLCAATAAQVAALGPVASGERLVKLGFMQQLRDVRAVLAAERNSGRDHEAKLVRALINCMEWLRTGATAAVSHDVDAGALACATFLAEAALQMRSEYPGVARESALRGIDVLEVDGVGGPATTHHLGSAVRVEKSFLEIKATYGAAQLAQAQAQLLRALMTGAIVHHIAKFHGKAPSAAEKHVPVEYVLKGVALFASKSPARLPTLDFQMRLPWPSARESVASTSAASAELPGPAASAALPGPVWTWHENCTVTFQIC